MESTRHIRSVCRVRSAGHLSRCWALIWTELQYLSWGSLTILWLESRRVGAEEMAPWIRALAAQVWGPEFRREKLGVVTSACHPGLGRQTGESAELAGLVGGKELDPRFSERPCLKGLRWRWPPLGFGGLHTRTHSSNEREMLLPRGQPSWLCTWLFCPGYFFHFLVRSDQLRLIVEVWTLCEANTGIPGWMLTQLHGLHVRTWPSANYRTLSLP